MSAEEPLAEWQDALAGLNMQSRNGKTARHLIDAAERQFMLLEQRAADEAATELREVSERAAFAEAGMKSRDAQIAEQRERADAAHRRAEKFLEELKERQSSTPTVLVKGKGVEFEFEPHTRDYSRGVWFLDELESVITYLRVNGGVDTTQLRVDHQSIEAVVEDPGFVPAPHRPPERESTRLEEVALRWFGWRDGGLFALGSFAAAGVGAVLAIAQGVFPW